MSMESAGYTGYQGFAMLVTGFAILVTGFAMLVTGFAILSFRYFSCVIDPRLSSKLGR